ncbi:MAG TPA: hypothetical protein VJR02_13040 [Pyrinomonadaceae bacterium]|nr:hypothetical protein [Pyrinomonadaceae bacterium]
MNYRTYRTLVVVAVLLLVGVAAPASLGVQSSQSTYAQVALIAFNRKYVAAEGGGGRELVANRDARGPWESFNVVYLGNDRVALRASNGQYVSATGPNGTLLANRDCIGPTETFLLIRGRENRIALKASNGKFVCAEGGGGRELIANRDVAAEWEGFYLLPL